MPIVTPTFSVIEMAETHTEAKRWIDKYFIPVIKHPVSYREARKVTHELVEWAEKDPQRREVAKLVIKQISKVMPLDVILGNILAERRN